MIRRSESESGGELVRSRLMVALTAALLVIAGQMVSGAMIDTLRHGGEGAPLRALGVLVILAGVALASQR